MESKIAFAHILMARMEQAILRQNKEKPLVWKSFIDDMIFFIWDTNKEEKIELFIEKADAYHLIIKCTDEVSEIETTFLDTIVYKGKRFEKKESSMCVHISSLLKHFIAVHTLQQLSPSGR